MNDMEKFLNFSAVVKVERTNKDDLWNFLELIKSVGFLDEYIIYFQKNVAQIVNIMSIQKMNFGVWYHQIAKINIAHV